MLSVATRLMAVLNSDRASQQMPVYYDLRVKVHQYQMLDSVGVRVPGKHARKGVTANSLPGLVIGVHPHRVGQGKTVEHVLYTVWCEYGVLKDKLKVDKLVTLSLNNFPHLRSFIDKLTPHERLSPKDKSYQAPLDGMAQHIARITVKEAWKAQLAARQQRVTDQSRKRDVAPRLAANAADTHSHAGRPAQGAVAGHRQQPASRQRSCSDKRPRQRRGLHSERKQVAVSGPIHSARGQPDGAMGEQAGCTCPRCAGMARPAAAAAGAQQYN